MLYNPIFNCTEFDTIIPAIALTLKPLEDAPHRKAFIKFIV